MNKDQELVELGGELVEIDKHLIKVIKKLNSLGCKTMYCCQGFSDHPNEKTMHSISFYISIGNDSKIPDDFISCVKNYTNIETYHDRIVMRSNMAFNKKAGINITKTMELNKTICKLLEKWAE